MSEGKLKQSNFSINRGRKVEGSWEISVENIVKIKVYHELSLKIIRWIKLHEI